MFVSVVIIAMLLFVIFDNNRAINTLIAKNKKLQEKIDILTKRLQAVENKEEENKYSSVVQKEDILSGEEKTQYDVFTKTDICENNTINEFIPIEGNSSSELSLSLNHLIKSSSGFWVSLASGLM